MTTVEDWSAAIRRSDKYVRINRRFRFINVSVTIIILLLGFCTSIYLNQVLPLLSAGAIVMGWAQIAGF